MYFFAAEILITRNRSRQYSAYRVLLAKSQTFRAIVQTKQQDQFRFNHSPAHLAGKCHFLYRSLHKARNPITTAKGAAVPLPEISEDFREE
jgi:hypothetical protein